MTQYHKKIAPEYFAGMLSPFRFEWNEGARIRVTFTKDAISGIGIAFVEKVYVYEKGEFVSVDGDHPLLYWLMKGATMYLWQALDCTLEDLELREKHEDFD